MISWRTNFGDRISTMVSDRIEVVIKAPMIKTMFDSNGVIESSSCLWRLKALAARISDASP